MTWSRERIEALTRSFLLPANATSSKERKRRRIVAAAAELFVQHGYRKTSVGDVAKAAGVAKGTVYLYFESKAELLLYAVMAEKAPLIPRFMAVMEQPDPRKRLHAYLLETFRCMPLVPLSRRFGDENSEFEAALAELSPELTAQLTEARADSLAHLVGPFVLAAGGTEADVAERSTALVALLYAMPSVMDKATELGLAPDRAADLYADLLVEGFARPFDPTEPEDA